MGKLATDPIDNIDELTLVKTWGRWFAYNDTLPHRGDVHCLIAGEGNCPVLAAQDLGRKLEALHAHE
ncbi:MAG: hypothetical protein GY906_33620 [bacterium]|nr:hypothetical protein [bacterium]